MIKIKNGPELSCYDSEFYPKETSLVQRAQALDSLGVGTWDVDEGSSLEVGSLYAKTRHKGLDVSIRTNRTLKTFEVKLSIYYVQNCNHFCADEAVHCRCGVKLTSEKLPVDSRMLASVVKALERMKIAELVSVLGSPSEVSK